jgi:hypothetical protein
MDDKKYPLDEKDSWKWNEVQAKYSLNEAMARLLDAHANNDLSGVPFSGTMLRLARARAMLDGIE